jgi:hypothetical protein
MKNLKWELSEVYSALEYAVTHMDDPESKVAQELERARKIVDRRLEQINRKEKQENNNE